MRSRVGTAAPTMTATVTVGSDRTWEDDDASADGDPTCYLCRRAGHIFTDCPHRVAGVALPGSAAATADAPRAAPRPPPRGALTTPRYLAARASTPSPPALRNRLRRRHRLGGAVAVAAAAPGRGAGGAAPHTTTLLAAADVGCADATGFASVTVDAGSGLVYVGDSRGRVHRVDPRAPGRRPGAPGARMRSGGSTRSPSMPATGGCWPPPAATGRCGCGTCAACRRAAVPAAGGGSVGRRTAGAVGGATANRPSMGRPSPPTRARGCS
ncbi:hypothetical protein BU14_0068s0013 [Porphyra umbilicalis]|uniref:CCHC-type domain-containing protein n=1 Tax=Porphyra umbilicalis TaxID=2786 RepID=A0A1X6PGD4_PORUM|nr:hypothetical protein BU14_0068s0013 [Porphyra umbilicalis]|eukprot:OSX79917.1 hypothetical protein BU14_0068s0013 [Porphyra umbilicalis]